MICGTCLRRATGFGPSALHATRPIASSSSSSSARALFTTSIRARNATPAAAAEASTAPAIPANIAGASTAAAQGEAKEPLSSCPAGTVLNGLNYFKGRTDPQALPDEAYPEWLWRCLEVQKKTDVEDAADAGDAFSKSKKQRRLANKRLRQLEDKARSGDVDALIPKIPLQKQSVNLPGSEGDDVVAAVQAVDKRDELRKAMRKERRAKIKESNYLKSM
ncbi:mitochondrial ribosomal protein L37-domain-containing protein [Apodospora peruviana]|uniref:Large ribosomal subunit protein mL54 n=1 Tax=Apodospora peruviana TaxID=516989 RepID=A0AAE0IS11_9PEZI|nr:mitochondrial ribosomal protein L37-domain-containing protein [Apodospora peruviana]